MQLLMYLIERMSVVVTIAYLLSQTKIFRKLILNNAKTYEKLILVIIFGIIGIYGTYSGIPIKGALANSRVIGVVVGGLLGGPMVGFGAGVIAGVHRYSIGGFTNLACGIATILEGLFGGLIYYYLNRKGEKLNGWVALAVGITAEMAQMLIILIVAKPFTEALSLVKVIALPMIATNAIGIAIFIIIVKNILQEEKRIGAVVAQKTLKIANITLPFLREGLSIATATKAAETIYNMSDVAAVAITDTEKILAHIGDGSDHHMAGGTIKTKGTLAVLKNGIFNVITSKEDIGCSDRKCPLSTAVIVPLIKKEQIVGTLKLYRVGSQEISDLDTEYAQGLAALFSTQLELTELDRQNKLLAKAELKALQAQINPHFFFNAINTIITYVRTKPDKARELLSDLSDFFRKNLHTKDYVTLEEELEHVKAYVNISEARFGDKLKVELNVEPAALKALLPNLTLQPLVENAIRHGVLPKGEGKVVIDAVVSNGYLDLKISDNGVGIAADKLINLLDSDDREGSYGIGLVNVNERLKNIYGKENTLKIFSAEEKGTIVEFKIPVSEVRE